jgi:hypothetical protein
VINCGNTLLLQVAQKSTWIHDQYKPSGCRATRVQVWPWHDTLFYYSHIYAQCPPYSPTLGLLSSLSFKPFLNPAPGQMAGTMYTVLFRPTLRSQVTTVTEEMDKKFACLQCDGCSGHISAGQEMFILSHLRRRRDAHLFMAVTGHKGRRVGQNSTVFYMSLSLAGVL